MYDPCKENLHEHIRGNWSEEKRQKRQEMNKSKICQSNSYLLCAALVSKSTSESSYAVLVMIICSVIIILGDLSAGLVS